MEQQSQVMHSESVSLNYAECRLPFRPRLHFVCDERKRNMHMEFPRDDWARQLIRKIRISSIFALEDVDSGCCCKELCKYYLLIEYSIFERAAFIWAVMTWTPQIRERKSRGILGFSGRLDDKCTICSITLTINSLSIAIYSHKSDLYIIYYPFLSVPSLTVMYHTFGCLEGRHLHPTRRPHFLRKQQTQENTDPSKRNRQHKSILQRIRKNP